jgi:hypothetical protein
MPGPMTTIGQMLPNHRPSAPTLPPLDSQMRLDSVRVRVPDVIVATLSKGLGVYVSGPNITTS